MRAALSEAQQAAEKDEVPVGAVVVKDGRIIGRGHDRKIGLNDPTAHAEILAIGAASGALGDWRLEGCTLYVTLEPCPMCAGAILLARIPRLVYGAPNPKFGAVESVTSLLKDDLDWNHAVEVIPGILAEKCAAEMRQYFSGKRREQKKD